MTFQATMQADLRAMMNHAPESFRGTVTHGGVDVYADFSPLHRSDNVDPASEYNNAEMTATAVTADFTGGVPDVRRTVAVTCAGLGISEQSYYVDSKITDAAGVLMTLARI